MNLLPSPGKGDDDNDDLDDVENAQDDEWSGGKN